MWLPYSCTTVVNIDLALSANIKKLSAGLGVSIAAEDEFNLLLDAFLRANPHHKSHLLQAIVNLGLDVNLDLFGINNLGECLHEKDVPSILTSQCGLEPNSVILVS